MTEELIQKSTNPEVQMSSSSKEVVEKLKQVINGKFNIKSEKRVQSLKRSLEGLDTQIKEKKTKLQQLKRIQGRSTINQTGRVQIEPTTSQESIQ